MGLTTLAGVALVAATAGALREDPNPVDLDPADRLLAIERELDHLPKHPWAGRYALIGFGGPTRPSIWIAPNAGVCQVRRGCTGVTWTGGTVRPIDERRLHVALTTRRELDPPSAETWHVVPWGDTRYLVADRLMQTFCNAVNAGRNVYHPRLVPDAGAAAMPPYGDRPFGWPQVPAKFAPYLLRHPVHAHVFELGEKETLERRGRTITRHHATIGAGELDGLLPGMVLFVDTERTTFRGRVTEVDPCTARAYFEKPVSFGTRVSTRHPRARP